MADDSKPTQNEIEREKAKTTVHIAVVTILLEAFMKSLHERKVKHDASKLQSPEVEMFAVYGPKLKNTTYGSDEYKTYLKEMGAALKHHYEHNRHHPEHFENGVDGMNLVDLVEMVLDWKASSLRHEDGDFLGSIDINAERFGLSPQLASILRNTAELLDEWSEDIGGVLT